MGIEVDTGGGGGASGDGCALGGRLRSARSEWDGATRDRAAACGLPVVQEAFRKLQDAWFTELGAHVTVLEQLGAALSDSTDTDQLRRAADGGQ